MKKKKMMENLRGMDKESLEKKLETLRGNEREIKFKAEGAKSKNVKEYKVLRREIAQVLTVMNTKA